MTAPLLNDAGPEWAHERHEATSSEPNVRESGQAIVFVAVLLVVLLGISALVIDVGRAYYTKRALQAQADASALAGAQGLPDSAQATALAKQYSGSVGSKNVQSGVKAVDTSVTVRCSPPGSTCPTANSVQVVEHAQVGTLLARVLGSTRSTSRPRRRPASPAGSRRT